MSALEVKRAEMELMKVQAARVELEFKIMERQEDIARIESHIQVQIDKEAELDIKIKTLKDAL